MYMYMYFPAIYHNIKSAVQLLPSNLQVHTYMYMYVQCIYMYMYLQSCIHVLVCFSLLFESSHHSFTKCSFLGSSYMYTVHDMIYAIHLAPPPPPPPLIEQCVYHIADIKYSQCSCVGVGRSSYGSHVYSLPSASSHSSSSLWSLARQIHVRTPQSLQAKRRRNDRRGTQQTRYKDLQYTCDVIYLASKNFIAELPATRGVW